jgi:hypothetical protein
VNKENFGCLALIFGVTRSIKPTATVTDAESNRHEGNVHSGPGGYEGMGYQDGYAADYFNGDDDHEH